MHVCSIQEKQLEMTRKTESAGIVDLEPTLRIGCPDLGPIVKEQTQAIGMDLQRKPKYGNHILSIQNTMPPHSPVGVCTSDYDYWGKD